MCMWNILFHTVSLNVQCGGYILKFDCRDPNINKSWILSWIVSWILNPTCESWIVSWIISWIPNPTCESRIVSWIIGWIQNQTRWKLDSKLDNKLDTESNL